MAHLESHIFTLLTTAPAVTAIVGARVFPKVLPPKTRLPALTFERVSGNYDADLEGVTGTANPRIQVSCWAMGYEQAKDLAKAVRTAMNAATDAANGFTALTLSDGDLYEDAQHYHCVWVDFSTWHEEE